MSAAAVVAVRPGSRRAFSVASSPAAVDAPQRPAEDGHERRHEPAREHGDGRTARRRRARRGADGRRCRRGRRACPGDRRHGHRERGEAGDERAPSRRSRRRPGLAQAAVGAMRVARTAGTSAASTVTPMPTIRPGAACRREHERHRRQPEAERGEELEDPRGERDADARADQRRDGAEEQARLEHGDEHLPAGGADAAQHRQLARALLDGDGERVEDDERADEHRDAGEGEQEVAQEVDPAGLLTHRAIACSAPVSTRSASGEVARAA